VDGERCGISVDATSASAVADAIARLLDDPTEAQAMADRGRAAVIERYSWNAASRSLLSLYERILAT
jgi:glycosyltransferase involved in cell wall biosynthesis